MSKHFHNNIATLGFDEQFFAEHLDKSDGLAIARVTSVHKDRFTVSDGEKEMFAEMAGKLLLKTNSVFDYPVVGDWARVAFHNEDTFAVIHSVLPRKSLLKRKAPGKKIEFQLIAANLDTAFIVQALDADFSLNRLERYLVMIHESQIEPVVLLSKRDLVFTEEIAARVEEINKRFASLKVVAFSNKTGEGVAEARALLAEKKTHCLLGSSGVGKTTFLNGIIGEKIFVTKEVREKDGKGRHATTKRQLIRLANGALIIDTPGMRELGQFAAQEGMEETFADIIQLAEQCKFSDCTHHHEKGCAVLAAIPDGSLSEKRYENFVKLNKEAAYNEMTYLDKRRKDKKFGKMCKEVMKVKKRLG